MLGPTRPLVLTADADLLEEVLRLAATAGVAVEVAHEVAPAARPWASAPLVLVGADLVAEVAEAGWERRGRVTVLGLDLDDARIWQQAVSVGAEHVVFLPDAEPWVIDLLGSTLEVVREPGQTVAVVGGRGGAGATTLAVCLALAGARRSADVLLVDGDPLGGGVDLVLRGEQTTGLRWPDLLGTRGRLSGGSLVAGLPRLEGLSVLSWDRSEPAALPAEAVCSVLGAGRRSADLVVVDLPRSLDEVTRDVLGLADTTLLVVPAELRAAAAAARLATRLAWECRDLRLVVRGPAPGRLSSEAIARSLGLPLAGELRAEPGLAVDLECGEVPGRRARSPLARFCDDLLDDLGIGAASTGAQGGGARAA